jgi:hypothetical protein
VSRWNIQLLEDEHEHGFSISEFRLNEYESERDNFCLLPSYFCLDLELFHGITGVPELCHNAVIANEMTCADNDQEVPISVRQPFDFW